LRDGEFSRDKFCDSRVTPTPDVFPKNVLRKELGEQQERFLGRGAPREDGNPGWDSWLTQAERDLDCGAGRDGLIVFGGGT
jgi:hypothetical protein